MKPKQTQLLFLWWFLRLLGGVWVVHSKDSTAVAHVVEGFTRVGVNLERNRALNP